MAERICSIKGCDRSVAYRGLCRPHYDSLLRYGDPLVARRRGSLARPDWERFWEKVDAGGDCWVWTGSVSNAGYGQFRSTKTGRGKTVSAHRWAWEALVGPIPPGKQLDHLCRNRLCVNVGSHLRLATPRQNTENGWSTARFNSLKGRCPNGHSYDRTFIRRGRPIRDCTVCDNEARRERRQQQRGTA